MERRRHHQRSGSGLAELLLYCAPTLVGPGLALAEVEALQRLADAPRLRFVDVAPLADDLRVIARFRPAPLA